jgi:hypothetical protein
MQQCTHLREFGSSRLEHPACILPQDCKELCEHVSQQASANSEKLLADLSVTAYVLKLVPLHVCTQLMAHDLFM